MIQTAITHEIKEALALAEIIQQRQSQDRLRQKYWGQCTQDEFDAWCKDDYTTYGAPDGRPYPWQVEFANESVEHPERGLIAANRIGKSECASPEIAVHATGLYPPWWEGRRFSQPVEIWCGAITNESSRDIQQKSLLGGIDEERNPRGTGWIPKEKIVDVTFRQCGVSGVVDTVFVRHTTGGVSEITFKVYEQGREKWQGTSKEIIWLDEEPNYDIYTEAQTRLLDKKGLMLFTATPLMGMSEVVKHFLHQKVEGVYVKNVTWDQAPHLDKTERERLLSSFPEYERETRAKGIPMMGAGAVFPVTDESLMCDPFEIPTYFHRIAGLDFGIDHPTAVAWVAYDADADTVYIYDCYRRRRETIPNHAQAINARGTHIPVAWPHDGMLRDRAGSGSSLRQLYEDCGVNMIGISARYTDDKGGGQPVDPITEDIYDRMKTGRFKVFNHLNDWFEEKRLYHRKDGRIVDENDDLMSATRYAVMMIRFALPDRRPKKELQAVAYEPLEEY